MDIQRAPKYIQILKEFGQIVYQRFQSQFQNIVVNYLPGGFNPALRMRDGNINSTLF